MWFGIFFFVLLVFACVYCEWYFSRKLLSLLVELTGQARKAEHLIQDGRVSTEEIFKGPWPNNEIGDLAGTFKALVTKLKSLAMREQDFSTEVSHELRTPLAVIDTSLVI